MATITLPTQGQTPWDGTLNAAITAVNDEVENHEERIEVLEAGGGGGSTAWADITGKPSTFPPTIGATGSTAVAGNDARLTNQRVPTANSVDNTKVADGALSPAKISGLDAAIEDGVNNGGIALEGDAETSKSAFWGRFEIGSEPTPPADGRVHWGFRTPA